MNPAAVSRRRLIYHISVVLAFLLLINFAVAGMFTQMENLSYTDAFFFAMSITTLAGYDGVTATTAATKWFVSFYQLFASALWSYIVTVITLSNIDRPACGHGVTASAVLGPKA